MSRSCLVCFDGMDGDADHHPKCLEAIFGKPILPEIDVEVAKLHTIGLAMVGRATLSGIQRKVSLSLLARKATLQLAVGPGRYILKPHSPVYPALPENEQLTIRLAALAGVETPPSALLRLRDGTLAYIALRFDRSAEGGKRRQEDFCQLAEAPPKEKYNGSAELCARIVRRYASEPGVEMLKLFRLMVVAWWTGNGDMHLKNFSLLAGTDGLHRLSPAYDQICTRLVIEDDELALPIGGKKKNLTRRTWRDYAEYCGLPERPAARVLSGIAAVKDEALALISRSPLNEAMRHTYAALIRKRTRVIETAAVG